MTDPEGWCVLSLQKFPRALKKRLKMKAAELDIDLQDLCAQYLQAALDEKESERPTKAKTK